MNSRSLMQTARLAGLLYLIWIITGLFVMFYIPSQIDLKGDAATAAQSLLSNELLFRTGVVTDLIGGVLWVLMVLVFYRLFVSVDERQAKLLVALVLVQIPVVIIVEAFNIAALMILKGEVLKTFELAQKQDLALLLLRMNDYGTLAVEMFWGLWLLPLASLVYRSRFLPRFLGVWLMINGLALLVLSFTSLLLPEFKDLVFKLVFPAMLGEVAIMLWLLFVGAKLNSPNHAPNPS
jgi:hypothetical protein